MTMKISMTFLFVLVTGIHGLPSASSKADFYENYEYSSDDNYSSDYSSDDYQFNDEERVVHATPKFVTREQSIMVNEGETIKLPCLVDKIDGFVMMWKKGEQNIISVGDNIMKKNPRMKLENSANGSTLVISLANPSDAGEYICQLSLAKPHEIRHNVRVRIAPVIRSNPPNGVLIVKQGDSATLSCDVIKGSPAPQITWSRKHRKLPSGDEENSALSLTFPRTTRHHSGVYICSADNGFGQPVTAEVKLDVHHAPVIEVDETFIHTKEDDETEVICKIHSSPRPKVEWFKNGKILGKDEGIVKERGGVHTLLLPGIRQPTFGNYSCRATNKFGSDEKSVEVSGRAGPPSFKSEPEGLEETSFVLEWVAESITPIKAFKIEYKPYDFGGSLSSYSSNDINDERADEGWVEILVVPKHTEDHYYTGKHTIQGLSPMTRYLARVSSQNQYGFSSPAQFKFGTKGAAPVHQPSIGRSSAVFPSLSLSFLLLMLSAVAPGWLQ